MATSGEPARPSDLDTVIAAALADEFGAWSSWTPTLANITNVNGTLDCKYVQVGKTVLWRFSFTLGSSSAMGTGPTFTPPVAAHSGFTGRQVGWASFHDTGTGIFHGLVMESGGAFAPTIYNVSATYATRTAPTNLIPHTWANTDILAAAGMYEAA